MKREWTEEDVKRLVPEAKLKDSADLPTRNIYQMTDDNGQDWFVHRLSPQWLALLESRESLEKVTADRDALRVFIADIHTVAVMGDGCLPGEQMRQMKALAEGFK